MHWINFIQMLFNLSFRNYDIESKVLELSLNEVQFCQLCLELIFLLIAKKVSVPHAVFGVSLATTFILMLSFYLLILPKLLRQCM